MLREVLPDAFKMRLRPFFLLLLVLLVIGLYFLVAHIVAFIQIFFQHAGIAITQEEIAAAHIAKSHFIGGDAHPRPALIPKRIHHIFHNWKNVSMPKHWDETRQTCMETNPGWEFMLWSEETSRAFLASHYSWFLDTYDSYPNPIQRVDVIKYFLLLFYGGIYLDMDNGCSTSLEPLLYYPTWTTDGGRGALSNNVLGSAPNHPFWQLLTDSLVPYSYNFLFPYVTISYASGQWFETAVWDAYHAKLPPNGDKLHRIMMDDRPGSARWVYFTQTTFGGTWNSWDNVMFLWIGDHLILLGLNACGILGLTCWAVMQFLRRSRRPRSIAESYLPLGQDDETGVELDERGRKAFRLLLILQLFAMS